MPINFACPRCAKALSIATRKAGAAVACPACNQKVIVPTPSDEPLPGVPIEVREPTAQTTEPDVPTPIEPPTPQPRRTVRRDDYDDELVLRRRKKRAPGTGTILVIGLFGIATLVMVVAAIIRQDRRKDTAKTDPKQKVVAKADAQPRQPERETEALRVRRDDSSEDDEQWARRNAYYIAGSIYLFLSILMAVWVVRDTRNRSVENGVMWMLLIVPFNLVALLIYLASRPHGSLIGCEKCGNRRLAFVGICPHCRQPVRARGRVR